MRRRLMVMMRKRPNYRVYDLLDPLVDIFIVKVSQYLRHGDAADAQMGS